MRSEDYPLPVWVRTSIYRLLLGMMLVSKVVVVGSPPRAMTSPALSNWLGFQYPGMASFLLSGVFQPVKSCWLLLRYVSRYCTLGVTVPDWLLWWFMDVNGEGPLVGCFRPSEAGEAFSGTKKTSPLGGQSQLRGL